MSAVLVMHHVDSDFRPSWLTAVCGEARTTGCDVANRSAVSSWLGLPLATWGLGFYLAFTGLLTAAFVRPLSRALPAAILVGVVGVTVDIALGVWSVAVLRAVCVLCAVTWAATVVAMGLAGSAIAKVRKFAHESGEGGPLVVQRNVPAGALWCVGALSVVSLTGWYTAAVDQGGGPDAVAVEDRDPDRALADAWRVFHAHFEATPQHEGVATADASYRGARAGDAVLELVVFADFLCPHCARVVERLERFTDRHRDSVRLVLRHCPFDPSCNPEAEVDHRGACMLARAAEAAALQGRFWPMSRTLFASRNAWPLGVRVDEIVNLAERLGLDGERFARDLESEFVGSRIAADLDAADRFGVDATPTLFVNGRDTGSIPIDAFLEELLREEATRNAPFFSHLDPTRTASSR